MYTSPVSLGACEMVNAIGALHIVLPANEIDRGGVEVGVIDVSGVDMADCVGNSTVAVCDGDWLNVKFPLESDTAHFTATCVPRFSNSIRVASFASIAARWLKLLGTCTVVAMAVVIADERFVVFAVGIQPDVTIAVCICAPMLTCGVGMVKFSISVRRRTPSGGAGTTNPF